jgi:hypothetical protein
VTVTVGAVAMARTVGVRGPTHWHVAVSAAGAVLEKQAGVAMPAARFWTGRCSVEVAVTEELEVCVRVVVTEPVAVRTLVERNVLVLVPVRVASEVLPLVTVLVTVYREEVVSLIVTVL